MGTFTSLSATSLYLSIVYKDCIALAVQGAISLFNVRNDESNDIWKSLSNQTQGVITPYMESK